MTHRTMGSLLMEQQDIVIAHSKLETFSHAELAKINMLNEKNLNSGVLNPDSTQRNTWEHL